MNRMKKQEVIDMATIEKRSKGVYRIKVFMHVDANGKSVFKSKTVRPKETAPSKIEKELNMAAYEFEKACKQGKVFDGDTLTFSEFYEKWFEECAGKLSPAERESNKANIERVFVPDLGTIAMSKISSYNIQTIVNRLTNEGLTAKTVRKYYSQISPVFKRAYQWRVISENPCATGLIELPKTKKSQGIKTFSESQARHFLSFCSSGTIDVIVAETIRKNGRRIPAHVETYQIPYQIYLFFMLACYTGMRRGELLALTWKDVDLTACIVHVKHSASHAKDEGGRFIKDTKTTAGKRDIPLISSLVPLLKEWKRRQQERMRILGTAWQGSKTSENQFRFIQDNGKGMDVYTPTKTFKKVLALYNLTTAREEERIPDDLTLHGLRHLYGSILLANGVPIATVSKLMGHSTVAVTMEVYMHDVSEPEETRNQIERIFQTKEEVQETPRFLG